MHSWPEDHRRGLAALTAGVAALGVVAAWQGFAWADTRSWVPDLLAGWTLAGLGLAAATLERSRGAAGLLLASGVAWFIGDFHATGPYALGWLALHVSWVFIAPLVQLALAYPSGRPRSLVTIAVMGATWVATATPWVNWNDDITLATAIAALALFRLAELTARGPTRREVAAQLFVSPKTVDATRARDTIVGGSRTPPASTSRPTRGPSRRRAILIHAAAGFSYGNGASRTHPAGGRRKLPPTPAKLRL